MGFRNGAYATVWKQPKLVSPSLANVLISVSVKDKETGTYHDEFNNFVTFCGRDVAKAAANLKERDRIILGNVDSTTQYDREAQTKYYNYKVFGFKMADGKHSYGYGVSDSKNDGKSFGGTSKTSKNDYKKSETKKAPVKEPEEDIDLDLDSDELPF